MGIIDAVRYILSIPTNILMIISSSLGYFYFAGLSTFALLFVRGHYHASQAEAELVLALLVGGVVGVAAAGLAVAIAALGLVAERWLFFAEAKHTVMLYYGAEAV